MAEKLIGLQKEAFQPAAIVAEILKVQAASKQ